MMFNSEANTRGQLQGDSTARMVMNHVRQLISTKVSGLAGDYTTLSAVGVTTQKDNTLKFDESAFSDRNISRFFVGQRLILKVIRVGSYGRHSSIHEYHPR